MLRAILWELTNKTRHMKEGGGSGLETKYQLAENPEFVRLVESVGKAYWSYIKAMSAAIQNVEKTRKLAEENVRLEEPDYDEKTLAAAKEFQGSELPQALERMRDVNIATHIYGIKDWYAVLAAIHMMSEDFSGDEGVKAELEALFKKTEAVNNRIFRNLSRFSDDMIGADALSITDTNAFPEGEQITPFTTREWELLIKTLQDVFDKQTASASEKIASKPKILASNRAKILELEDQRPTLLGILDEEGAKLTPPVRDINERMMAEYGRVDGVAHATLTNPRSYYQKSFRDWKNELLLEALIKSRGIDFNTGMRRSLENELGLASYNNHFDSFFVDASGEHIPGGHHHKTLDILLFLALSNEYFDVELFRGELRPYEYYSESNRTADFVIPRNGAVKAGILKTEA